MLRALSVFACLAVPVAAQAVDPIFQEETIVQHGPWKYTRPAVPGGSGPGGVAVGYRGGAILSLGRYLPGTRRVRSLRHGSGFVRFRVKGMQVKRLDGGVVTELDGSIPGMHTPPGLGWRLTLITTEELPYEEIHAIANEAMRCMEVQ